MIDWSMMFAAGAFGAVTGTIAIAMIHEGANFLTRALGHFLLAAAGAVAFTLGYWSTSPPMNHDECAQYVWTQADWKCVPWEEAG